MNIEKTLTDAGYRKFRHKSGFIGWSLTDLEQYSDEWREITSYHVNN